jgi:gliding motility-associated lipoprotein GldH
MMPFKLQTYTRILKTAAKGLMFGLFLWVTTSCDHNMVFEKNKAMDQFVWGSKDVVKFNVPINDPNLLYNFYLNIRINSDYKFANLFVFMKTIYPNGQLSVDTVECFLADIDGRWLGERSGKVIDNRILLRKKLKFKESGMYSFEFEQGMRDTALLNVEDFGIRIEKAEQ